MHSFVGQSSIRELCPRALLLSLERERTEGRKREKFYIYSDVTHTHTRPEPGQPWKARGRKKRKQTTGKRPKQRRGGRGTDGPPKPTYTAKRTWPKQCTHLNPTTHYGEARGKLGTKWGTSSVLKLAIMTMLLPNTSLLFENSAKKNSRLKCSDFLHIA